MSGDKYQLGTTLPVLWSANYLPSYLNITLYGHGNGASNGRVYLLVESHSTWQWMDNITGSISKNVVPGDYKVRVYDYISGVEGYGPPDNGFFTIQSTDDKSSKGLSLQVIIPLAIIGFFVVFICVRVTILLSFYAFMRYAFKVMML
jgi:hypothetical protein